MDCILLTFTKIRSCASVSMVWHQGCDFPHASYASLGVSLFLTQNEFNKINREIYKSYNLLYMYLHVCFSSWMWWGRLGPSVPWRSWWSRLTTRACQTTLLSTWGRLMLLEQLTFHTVTCERLNLSYQSWQLIFSCCLLNS